MYDNLFCFIFYFTDSAHEEEKQEIEELKVEFREHFKNITRVIDCVGCDKCKLWGKLQV